MTIDQRLRSAAADARDRVRHLDVPTLAPRRPGWVVALATGAAVLIVAAVVWLLGLTASDEPPVVDTVPTTVTLPPPIGGAVEPLPDEAGTWAVETSLGTWTWTRVDGAVGTVPGSGFFYADGAYWALDMTWTPEGVLQSQQMWRSDDGVNWDLTTVPESLLGRDVTVSQAGDGVWAIDHLSSQLLRFVGDGEWEASDTPSIPFPSIESVQSSFSGSAQVSTSGDSSIATLRSMAGIDFSSIHEGGMSRWDHSAQTVTLFDWNGELSERVLDYEVVTGQREELRFTDPGTGDVVLVIDTSGTGVSADSFTSDQGASLWSLLADSGSGFVEVAAPWAAYPIDLVQIGVGPRGFLAVALDQVWSQGVGPTLHTFRSLDGVTWKELPAAEAPESVSWFELTGGPNDLLLLFTFDYGGGQMWKTVDGADWEKTSPDLVGSPNAPGATSWGWAHPGLAAFGVNGGEIWPISISSDGAEWEKVTLAPGISPDDGMISTGAHVVNDLVFATREFIDGTRHLWVGGLQR